MKRLKLKLTSAYCYFFGHKYSVTRRINKEIAELTCSRCKKEFAINTYVQSLLPLDNELRELHNDLVRDRTKKIT